MSVASEPRRTPEEPDKQTIRVFIDGRWSALDMATQFSALDYVYTAERLFDRYLNFSPVPGQIYARIDITSPKSPFPRAIRDYLLTRKWSPFLDSLLVRPLTIESIRYGSPGHQDLGGVGRSIHEIFEFIRYLMERKPRRERHEAEMRTAELQQERMSIANQQARFNFMKKAGFTEQEIQRANLRWAQQEGIIGTLIEQEKIVDIEYLSPKSSADKT